jgi:hypothetical protein
MKMNNCCVLGSLLVGLVMMMSEESAHAEGGAAAGTTPSVTTVASKPGSTVKVHGSLATGSKIDLAFASTSANACFPSIRNNHFNGNQVLFRTTLPSSSIMKIRAIPSRPDLDVNLYAYSTGVGSKELPPNVSRVVSCEASHGGRVRMDQPFNPGETEQVQLNAIKNPYDVVIAVAGGQGITAGDFDLEIELSGGGPPAPTGKITSATSIAALPGKTVSVQGKIDGGVQIPLGFAAQSSVACFVATTNAHYTGKHVVYSFDLPPRTTAKIELVPADAKTDVSLYAYSVGPSFPALPPEVSSVVSCEASPAANRAPNPGGTEKVELVAITNPYKVFVGVAGAENAQAGSFTLKITLSPR